MINPKPCILLMLLLTLTAFGQGRTGEPNYLITADSAGDVRLGMTIADVRRMMPDARLIPDLTDANLTRYESNYAPFSVLQDGKVVMSLMTLKYDEDGENVPFSENAEIVLIKIRDSHYRTASGAHPGMTIQKAERIFGKITEIFGFYGEDESAQFSNHPDGFEFLVFGQRSADGKHPAGLYEDGRADFAYKYTLGAYIFSISISGSKKTE